jgi:hypothetical protein
MAKRSLYRTSGILLLGLLTGMLSSVNVPAQGVAPGTATSPAANPATPLYPTSNSNLVPPPSICDTEPCFRSDPQDTQNPAAIPPTVPNSVNTTDPLADHPIAAADTTIQTYNALTPLAQSAAKQLPNSNPLSIFSNIPTEVPTVLEHGVTGLQIAVSCYEGAQKDGLSGCAKEAAKEAALTTVQTVGTEVGTCVFAETGPFAPVLGAGVGLCARAAANYALDHPAAFAHAFDCDPYGNCVTNPTLDAPSAPSSARQSMEQDFGQISGQNDAAQAAQDAADAQMSQSSSSDDGLVDFMNFLSLDLSATLRQSQRAPVVPVSPSTTSAPTAPSIPAGWVPCSCPSQHASAGHYFGSQLYHPDGLSCHP